jgi:hypothetical protein
LDAVCGAENAYPLGSRCAGGGAGGEAIPVGHESGEGLVLTWSRVEWNAVGEV